MGISASVQQRVTASDGSIFALPSMFLEGALALYAGVGRHGWARLRRNLGRRRLSQCSAVERAVTLAWTHPPTPVALCVCPAMISVRSSPSRVSASPHPKLRQHRAHPVLPELFLVVFVSTTAPVPDRDSLAVKRRYDACVAGSVTTAMPHEPRLPEKQRGIDVSRRQAACGPATAERDGLCRSCTGAPHAGARV